MSVKALGTSLKLTFEGKNQLIFPETWFFMLVVVTCVIIQMNYLNKVGNLYYFFDILRLACSRLTLKIMFEFSVSQNKDSN